MQKLILETFPAPSEGMLLSFKDIIVLVVSCGAWSILTYTYP
jgi:hypothetical protein